RYCSACQGLFFTADGGNRCPAGGSHDSRDSGDYDIDVSSRSSTSGDDAQGISHVDPFAADGVIGQIFFVTNSSEVDEQDAEELNKIAPAYLPDLNVPGRHVEFRFRGFADHRPTTKTNLALSEARARAVRDYIRDRFFGHPSFASTLQALGVHPSSQAA